MDKIIAEMKARVLLIGKSCDEGNALNHYADRLLALKGEPVAWRITDGEGDFNYRSDPPSDVDVRWVAQYGRKHEPLYTHPSPPISNELREAVARVENSNYLITTAYLRAMTVADWQTIRAFLREQGV
jgi:hypothetical protein